MNLVPFDACDVTGHTLVGAWRGPAGMVARTYPIPGSGGNCFSVAVVGEFDDVRIVNFGLENLEELIRRGLTWPIKCFKLTDKIGVVCDGRIGDRWYAQDFCPICTPRKLLPLPQQLEHQRQVDRGEVTESFFEFEGLKIGMESHNLNNPKPQFQ